MKQTFIFRAEAAKICKVHPTTWDKIVKSGAIKPDGTTPPKKKYFDRKAVVRFAKRIGNNRKRGLPIIIEGFHEKKP